MAEGSIQLELTNLEAALSAVAELVGQAPSDGQPASGFAGAAAVAEGSPLATLVQFAGTLEGQLSGIVSFDASASASGSDGVFAQLQVSADFSPQAALDAFLELLSQADASLVGGLLGQLETAIETVRGLADGVPENRSGVFQALVEQALEVVSSLEGPEAGVIQGWARALEQQVRQWLPLIEEAQASPDPQSFAVDVFDAALDQVLGAFGFARIQVLLDALGDFPDNVLDGDGLAPAEAAFDAALGLFAEVRPLAGGDFDAFRGRLVATHNSLVDLQETLRRLLDGLRGFSDHGLLEPGAIEAFLRQQLDAVLSIEVQEAQTISDPFEGLLDRLDEAIAGIDLSSVRDDTLGFFERTRDAIQGVDLPSLAGLVDEQLTGVDNAVRAVQDGVSNLTSQVEGVFDGLLSRQQELLGQLGTFLPDGTFQFHLERDLRAALTSARDAIGGNPEDPDAVSVASTLGDLQSQVDGFFTEIQSILATLGAQADAVLDPAADAMAGFADFLTGLDIAGKLEVLRQKVEEVSQALLPIDFAVVVDPVVEVLDENAQKLSEINADDLNDLLRAALAAALDAVINIEFAVEISAPLKEELAKVNELPQAALDEIQKGYEKALERLSVLSPQEKLLEPLAAAFGVIDGALASVDLTTVLAPLDDLHHRLLEEPLEALRPSTLIAPLSEGFQGYAALLDGLDGASLIEPLTQPLEDLKSSVLDLDLTAPLDELTALVDGFRSDLEEIRPSQLLEPLVADFQRLVDELDRFKPSVLFGPVADLAAPLLDALETVQAETVEALFNLFQTPLQLLEDLEPEALSQRLAAGIDELLARLGQFNLAARVGQLKAAHFDLGGDLQAGGAGASAEVRLDMTASLDPEALLGGVVEDYNELVARLETLRDSLAEWDLGGLGELYGELQERLLAMLPPFARELLDPEAFRRIMRLADPTRFLEELDARFEEIKARLVPIDPSELAAELDAVYDEVLALVDGFEIGPALDAISQRFENIKSTVELLRVDFLAADLEQALETVRAFVNGIDPARLGEVLDPLHDDVMAVVASTRPSTVLAGLDGPMAELRALLDTLNPAVRLGEPLNEAWQAIQDILDGIDIALVLQPLVDRLQEIEADFFAGIERTEGAFDRMLGAAQGALAGGGSASASVGVSL